MHTNLIVMPILFDVPKLARVDVAIAPNQPGRVKFQASFWTARFYDSDCQVTVSPGESVWVVGRQGIKLLVKPVSQEHSFQVAA